MASKPRFQLIIDGKDVHPDTVPVSELATLLVNFERAIIATARAKSPEAAGTGVLVSLVGVEEGSNKLTVAVTSVALAAATVISHALHSRDFSLLPRDAHSFLHEISKEVAERNWRVELVESTTLGIAEGKISTDLPVPEPAPIPHETGTTTIYGRCVRVGGEEPKAVVRLHSGLLLYIAVSEDLAKDLGHHLYDDVIVEGEATWRTDNWTLVDFKAKRVHSAAFPDPSQAFAHLADAADNRWDGVDAIEYVRSVRLGGPS